MKIKMSPINCTLKFIYMFTLPGPRIKEPLHDARGKNKVLYESF